MITLVNTASLFSALNYAVDFCKQNDGCKIDIVVPDKLSLNMEQLIFENLQISASFNINVATLNRYAKRNNPVDKSKQISKLGCIILINKILNKNADKLKVIVSKNYSFSYAEEIFKTIYQLKASKITVDEMLNFKSSNQQLENKIKDLALIYSEYENLKAGLIDASDLFLLSTFSISEGRQNHKILFVGFDDYTALEYSLIEQLAKNCDVSLINYISNASNNYIYNKEIKSQIVNLANLNDINFKEIEYNCSLPPLKSFLQGNLFATIPQQFLIKQEEVKVLSCSSIVEEIEQVARDIKTKIFNGQNFSNFGVAVFDMQSKLDIIKQIFNKYEINFYLDSPLNLSQSVYFKFLVSVFKFNFEYNNLCHIIDIISSPFFVLNVEEKQKLIEYLTVINFKGKNLNHIKIKDNLTEQLNYLNTFLQLFNFKKNELVLELQNKLNYALTKIDAKTILNKITDAVDLKYQMLIKKSYESVENLFEEILNFYPELEAETFLQILLHLASIVEINNLPVALDAVKVVDANNFSEVFENLYFINCTATAAPNLKHDCGVILDNEINNLTFKHKLAPTIAHINKLQKLRLYNSALLFKNTLTVSYTVSQSELVKELLTKLTIKTGNAIINLHPSYINPFKNYTALSKWDYIEECIKNNISPNIDGLNYVKTNLKNANPSLEVYNFNTISASTLEHYFTCPFYCFLNDFLKIRPRLNSEVLALDVGNILHQIVYLYYKYNKQVGNKLNFIIENVNNCISKEERLIVNQNSPIIVQLIKECERILDGLDYIDANCLFTPTYFEYPFKESSSLNLGSINLIGKIDRVDVLNNGSKNQFRIIDYKTGNANASIGELYFGKKLQLFLYNLAMEQALKMQGVGSFYLPLHNKYEKAEKFNYSLQGFFVKDNEIIKALDKTLVAGNKSDIVNVSLYPNGNPYASDKILDAETFAQLKLYAKQISNKAVEEIKTGNIAPSPYKDACKYCPYVQVCLKNSNKTNTRGLMQVNLNSFKEGE